MIDVTKMTLESVTIRLKESYANENAETYVGEVKYKGQYGQIEIRLDDGFCEKLLIFLGPIIGEFGAKSAQAIAESVNQMVLENKVAPIEITEGEKV